jgi:hypothetical protein
MKISNRYRALKFEDFEEAPRRRAAEPMGEDCAPTDASS